MQWQCDNTDSTRRQNFIILIQEQTINGECHYIMLCWYKRKDGYVEYSVLKHLCDSVLLPQMISNAVGRMYTPLSHQIDTWCMKADTQYSEVP